MKKCQLCNSIKENNNISQNNNTNCLVYDSLKNRDKFINIDREVFKTLNRENYNKIRKNLVFKNNHIFLDIYDYEIIKNEDFNNYIKNELIKKIINNKKIIKEFIFQNYMDNYYNHKEIKIARKKYLNYIKKVKRNLIPEIKYKKYSDIQVIDLINKLSNYLNKNNINIKIGYEKIKKPEMILSINRNINGQFMNKKVQVNFIHNKNSKAGGLFHHFTNKIEIFTSELFPTKFSFSDILILFHEIGHAIESLLPEFKNEINKNREIISMFIENYIEYLLNNNKKCKSIHLEYLILKDKLINEKNLKNNFDIITIKFFYNLINFYLEYDYFNFLNYMKADSVYRKKSKFINIK